MIEIPGVIGLLVGIAAGVLSIISAVDNLIKRHREQGKHLGAARGIFFGKRS